VTFDPDALRRRLGAPLPGFEAQLRMAPRPRPHWPADGPPLRDAAALLLLYPQDGDWWVPLTVRASTLPHHTGQVSLPGGRLDAGETIEQAALREAYEEVGLATADVMVLGQLTPLPIPVSGHLLHPVVGLAASRPRFLLAAAEVERLIVAPLSLLREPATVQWKQRLLERPPGGMMDVPFFDVDGAHVWGATAMVLAELLAILAEVDGETTAS
jgi:8-oxo-dGTP pyrophosphatase MutT (NUDIX family)